MIVRVGDPEIRHDLLNIVCSKPVRHGGQKLSVFDSIKDALNHREDVVVHLLENPGEVVALAGRINLDRFIRHLWTPFRNVRRIDQVDPLKSRDSVEDRRHVVIELPWDGPTELLLGLGLDVDPEGLEDVVGRYPGAAQVIHLPIEGDSEGLETSFRTSQPVEVSVLCREGSSVLSASITLLIIRCGLPIDLPSSCQVRWSNKGCPTSKLSRNRGGRRVGPDSWSASRLCDYIRRLQDREVQAGGCQAN
jgi:hypothetical protein